MNDIKDQNNLTQNITDLTPAEGATDLPTLAELPGSWPPPPSLHPVEAYLSRLSSGSRRTMRQALERMAVLLSGGRLDSRAFPWPALRYQHTQALRTKLGEELAPATANKHLAALRGVLQETWRLGYISSDEHARAVDLKSFKGTRLPRGRALTQGEVRQLFAACAWDDTPAGRRDAAILGLLYGAGLRRAEIAGLQLADYNVQTSELKVRGKGDKERMVYAVNGGKVALNSWLLVRGAEPGPLFCPVNKAGALELREMTDQAVYNMVVKRAEQGGVESFTPHDLRRSFISELLDSGADIVTVQALAGHANPATTARYDRRGEKAKRKASEMLHVPVGG